MLAACGGKPADESAGRDAAAEEPARTFADDTIAVKEKARVRTEDAVEAHREALEQRLRQDEGGPAEPAEPADPPQE
jgi:hypothetical protein